MQYSPETVYFISYARLSHSIPAGKLLDTVGVGLIVHQVSGIVEDISCTLLTDEAKEFLKQIIVGFNIHKDDIDDLLNNITNRYHGMSQKAVCVAVTGAIERYQQWKSQLL